MTLNDLLSRYVTDCTDPIDINVDARDGSFYYIPGASGRIPTKIRDREVSHFAVDTETVDGKVIPLLCVTLKGRRV